MGWFDFHQAAKTEENGLLRSFAPRNDVKTQVRILAARCAPQLLAKPFAQETEGAGKAGCSLHPPPRVQSKKRPSGCPIRKLPPAIATSKWRNVPSRTSRLCHDVLTV